MTANENSPPRFLVGRAGAALLGFSLLGPLLIVLSSVGCGTNTVVAPPAASGTAPGTASASAAVPATTAPAPAAAVETQTLEGLPVTLVVAQRTTSVVPGTDGQLSITIDDVTRGQVMVSLLDKQAAPLAGPASLREGEAISFRFGPQAYSARIAKLTNVMAGEDFATIVIDAPSGSRVAVKTQAPTIVQLTEQQKIEKLIAAVAAQREAKFIRNGTAYSADEAADHLRVKFENARGRITTASDFIAKIASKSSVTGKDYAIKFSDGRTITTKEFLQDALAKLERPTAKPPGK